MATRAMVRVDWADEGRTCETHNKCNAGAKTDNIPKFEDWEHKLTVDKYLEE